MQTYYTQEQRELRQELREYFSQLMTPEVVAEVVGKEGGATFRKIIRQLGKDGVLTFGWPEEYGGKNYTALEQLILFEEAWSAHAPFPLITVNTVGPAIQKFGNAEQKAFFLPKIAAGECVFAVGYTEPGAGTDLGSLTTKATEDGDDYIINGIKAYTSSGHDCDYVWLAARTGSDVRRPSDGITLFILDAKDSGYSHTPIYTVAGMETNMTYYDNVRVPKSRIVGEVNSGWKLITSQLNHERVSLAAMTFIGKKQFGRLLREFSSNRARERLADPLIRSKLGELYSLLEAMEILNLRTACQIETGEIDVALASGVKFKNTLALIEALRDCLALTGEDALVKFGSPESIFAGDLERDYRNAQISTVGGGVLEVMRCMVASHGLNMPNTIT